MTFRVAKKSRVVAAVVSIIALCLVLLFALTNVFGVKRSFIEQRIITKCNENVQQRGKCYLDLALLFNDFDWDTVSIYVSGNNKQLSKELGIYNEFSDGIVFSLRGTPVFTASSTYSVPEGEPPALLYSIDQSENPELFFVTLPKDRAVVCVEKYYYQKTGAWKYILTNEQE